MKRIENNRFELGTLPSGFSIVIHKDSDKPTCQKPTYMNWFRPHIHITKDGETLTCIALDKAEYFDVCTYPKECITLSSDVLMELNDWLRSRPTDPDGLKYDTNYNWALDFWHKLSVDDYMPFRATIINPLVNMPDYTNITPYGDKLALWLWYNADEELSKCMDQIKAKHSLDVDNLFHDEHVTFKELQSLIKFKET